MPSVSCSPPLPGFGLDIDHNGKESDKCFPSALFTDIASRQSKIRLPMLTLREIAMLQFMNEVTDKNEWEHKIFDETITHKWVTETTQSPGTDFTIEMADYCISELKYKAKLLKKSGLVRVYNGDVIKSDNAIPAELQAALKAAVTPLEQVPAHRKDWRPCSDGKILDLVDPSLFPLVYGTSRILTSRTVGLEDCISLCGQDDVIPALPEARPPELIYSRMFQWLPCDVDVSGEKPKIVTYINNLHPGEHTRLYEVIEKCLEKILPLWNATLTPLRAMKWKQRIVYDSLDYGDLDAFTENEGPRQREDESKWEFRERKKAWKRSQIPDFIVHPNPGPYSCDDEDGLVDDEKGGDDRVQDNRVNEEDSKAEPVNLRKDYADTGLQIIVKLENVHLTPEKPTYDGGTWHVEGQLNEQICATAIYYYDVENISTTHLAFRQPSDVLWAEEKIIFEYGDLAWLNLIYGLLPESPAIQFVGRIQTREGRVVTFPNILQHRVEPFKLADPTRPGHCKVLTFYLVDPDIRIISTANIPCQQREWWGKEITKFNGGLGRLPFELKEKVLQEVNGFPLSLEQAKQIRKRLREEQTNCETGDPTELFEEVMIFRVTYNLAGGVWCRRG